MFIEMKENRTWKAPWKTGKGDEQAEPGGSSRGLWPSHPTQAMGLSLAGESPALDKAGCFLSTASPPVVQP